MVKKRKLQLGSNNATIALVVVAGILLILVGSYFTGYLTWNIGKGNEACGGCPKGKSCQTLADGSNMCLNTEMFVTSKIAALDMLNKCKAFEMGTAEPQLYFGKSYASGDEICDRIGNKIGKDLFCISAGRIYNTEDFTQTGYGIWSCGDNVVDSLAHNGWALCCNL